MVPSFHPDLLKGRQHLLAGIHAAVPGLDVVYVPIGQGSGACAPSLPSSPWRASCASSAWSAPTPPPTPTCWRRAGWWLRRVGTQLADGMACRIADQGALDMLLPHIDHLVKVTDAEVAQAMRALYADTHNVAEGARGKPCRRDAGTRAAHRPEGRPGAQRRQCRCGRVCQGAERGLKQPAQEFERT